MKYKFIEPLDPELIARRNSSLLALSQIWRDQEARLTKTNALFQFNEQIKRQWAIETGIIENLYTLDRGITVLLVEQGIHEALIPHYASNKNTRELVEILGDHKKSIDGIFDYVKGDRDLSLSFIKGLHQSLTEHQTTTEALDMFGNIGEVEFVRGQWKVNPNNPLREDGEIHEYCPPEHVQSEMDNLVQLYEQYTSMGVSPEILAAWLHHRFTQIHPFQDGNGRVARAIATLVFIKSKWFPLVIDRDQRITYISALEAADDGDLEPLVAIFTENQKNYFIRALSISEDVISSKSTIDQIIKSAVKRIEKSKAEIEKDRENVIANANSILNHAFSKLEILKSDLETSIFKVDRTVRFHVDRCSTGQEQWFKYNVINIAKELKFFANISRYSNWIRLKITSDDQFETVINGVSVGESFNGVVAFVAFLKVKSTELESSGYEFVRLSQDIFVVNYNDAPEQIYSSFDKWYNEIIAKSLTEWQRNL